MHDVTEIFAEVEGRKTRVWLSQSVRKNVLQYRKKSDPNGEFWKKLRWCCVVGFDYAEIAEIVRHEFKGVFRFGIDSKLFRIIGFYEHGKSSFIAIDSFLKSGQKLTNTQRQRVEEVARVAAEKLWRKVNKDGIPRNT